MPLITFREPSRKVIIRMSCALVRWSFGYCAARAYQHPEMKDAGLYWWFPVGKAGQRGRCIVAEDRPECFRSTIERISDADVYVEFAGELAQHGLAPPAGWAVRDPAFLMASQNSELPDQCPICAPGFTFETTRSPRSIETFAIDADGVRAAHGVVGLDGDVAVYDQIATEREFRRKGLGTAIMRLLGSAARAQGAKEHLLIATTAGRALYERLGWIVASEVTSVISPNPSP